MSLKSSSRMMGVSLPGRGLSRKDSGDLATCGHLSSSLRAHSAGPLSAAKPLINRPTPSSHSFSMGSGRKIVEDVLALAASFREPEVKEGILNSFKPFMSVKEDVSAQQSGPIPCKTEAPAPDDDNQSVLQELLSEIEQWPVFDIYKVAQASNGRPLAPVVKAVLKRLGLMSNPNFSIDPSRLDAFLSELEDRYLANPYHCSTHAADVVHAIFMIILMGGLANQLADWELLALVLAAAGHDVGHPGVSNKFLVESKDPIAAIYGPMSPNEKLHAATTTSLLLKHEVLPASLYGPTTTLISDVIMATDMAVHTTLVSDFKGHAALHGSDLRRWAGKARTCALGMQLHIADLGNVAKPREQAADWANGITAEMHQQGDRERALGMDVAPAYDRAQSNVPLSQHNFLTICNIRDAFVALSSIAPAFGQMALKHLDANLAFYDTLVKEGVKTL